MNGITLRKSQAGGWQLIESRYNVGITDFERLNLVWEVKRWVVPSNQNYRDQNNKKQQHSTEKKNDSSTRKIDHQTSFATFG